MLYSKSENGFFHAERHAHNLPVDAREISDELHASLVQELSQGKALAADANDMPVALWPAELPQPPMTIEKLMEQVTAHRWQVETGGITLPAGVYVATGIDDQNRITSVIANARLAGLESVSFKAASGWVTLTIAELEGIAAAIALHVQRCFSAERTHHEGIDALAALHAEDPEALQLALDAYDVEQGWPDTGLGEQVQHD